MASRGRAVVAVSSGFVAMVLAGCGGGGGSSPDAAVADSGGGAGQSGHDAAALDATTMSMPDVAPDTGPAGVDCADIAAAFCRAYARCYALFVPVTFGDRTTCEQRLGLLCAAAATAPGSGLTPDSARVCSATLDAAKCEDLTNGGFAGCSIAGAFTDGTGCFGDSQCQSAFCKPSTSSTCGACAPKQPAGHACVKNEECMTGLVCHGDGTSTNAMTCLAPGTKAATCGTNQPCGNGFYCEAGACAAVHQVSETCDAQDACDGSVGLFCNQDPKVNACQAVKVAGPGQACGVVSGSFVVCGAGGKCVTPNAQSVTGLCAAPLADGAACSAGADAVPCLGPAACVKGHCAVIDATACE